MGHKGFPLTILIDIISGRRVIDERNVILGKRKLWCMISRPFSSFLGFWNKTLKAFSSLFVEHRTALGAQHHLRVLQLAATKEINQFFFSHRISQFRFFIELRFRNNFIRHLGPPETSTI